MSFAAVIDLPSADPDSSVAVIGHVAGDTAGRAVAGAGDVNNDGYEDFLVGAAALGFGATTNGTVYVVFGGPGGMPSSLDLSSLTGANGFAITGAASGDRFGTSVAAVGDVNGDGVDDIIIGAELVEGPTYNTGAAYVIYGRDTAVDGAFAASLGVGGLNGANGFRVTMSAAIVPEFNESRFGRSVSSAGDINGDGIDDFVVGADKYGSADWGRAYVVFGQQSGFGSALDLSTLDGSNGFAIELLVLERSANNLGSSLSAGGDINGDGIDDLIVGAANTQNISSRAGAVYVIFGRNTAVDGDFAASLSPASLNGSDGFRFNGIARSDDFAGSSVASGDVNGDGLSDLIVGSRGFDAPGQGNSGAVFVLFGQPGGTTATVAASGLNGTNGFTIRGPLAGDSAGFSVTAGDVNGDGLDDIVVGAPYADPNGENSGSVFVVYGKRTAFAATLDLGGLDGSAGFRLDGPTTTNFTGFSVGVADLNNDGADEILIGSPQDDTAAANGGAAYVVWGQLAPQGTAGNDQLAGGLGPDSLTGLDGNDILSGLGGDDLLDGGDLSDRLYGGDGADDLVGGGGGDLLYGDAGDDVLDGGDGADKLFGGAGADQLIGSTGNDRMLGEDDADILEGQDGNDYLDGGAGADLMSGGYGNDVYIVDQAGDQAVEDADQGYDVVRASLTWTLADNLEALELQGSDNINGFGNAGANIIHGNMGDNVLEGGAGVDTLNGGDGDDLIVGGAGNDLMRGGSGQDTFDIDAINLLGPLETDQIFDFSSADGDVMDFGNIDANVLTVEDDSFTLVAAFTKVAGQMTAVFAAGVTTVRLDVNGDGKVDYQVKINGDVTGDTGDWFL